VPPPLAETTAIRLCPSPRPFSRPPSAPTVKCDERAIHQPPESPPKCAPDVPSRRRRRTFPSSGRWAPRCRSAADMGRVVEPVHGEVGVAVNADVGGFAVGERESSGQGQQQRSCPAGHRHIGPLGSGLPVAPSGRRSTNQAPASSTVSVASQCRVCPVPRIRPAYLAESRHPRQRSPVPPFQGWFG
jgi:hypothetical protein